MKEEIVAGLISLGCSRRYDNDDYSWSYKGYSFTVGQKATLTDVFRILFRMAETLKIWEIKSVLNILE